MRVLRLFLIAAMFAVAALLAGCGGDEQAQQQAQPEQQQSEQTAQRATTSADGRQSEEEASEAEQEADPQAADREDEAQPTQALDDPEADPLFAAAQAAFDAWSADLESFEMAIDVDLNLGGLSAQVTTAVVVQLEPFMALTTIDASSLLEVAGELADDEQAGLDQPLLMQVLFSEDAAYLSMPQIGGWIDLSDQFEETLAGLTAMLGTNPEDVSDPDQLGQALDCVDAIGGSISEGRHADQPVWFVECTVDVDALNSAAAQRLNAQGIDVTDAGIESAVLRLAISQTSGAPLLLETEARLRDAFGLSGGEAEDSDDDPGFYVLTVANLISWNEPVEFPTPEPLVDGSLLQDFGESSAEDPGAGRAPTELLTPDQLLELASDWVANADELHVEFIAQAVIDGEACLASVIVRSSRIAGAFETTVNIDGASTFRLLWNRDGIWTSDVEENGGPIWAPSNPALLGFAGMTVDEFLANPDRFNLDPLKALLDISWVTRTIEGGGPPVYELVIESGPLAGDNAHFAQVVEVLKADTTELLAESVTIESIEHYSTILTMSGDDGRLASQVTTAEFQTSAGRVDLVANLHLVSDGPIEFSRPTE